jgi:uncharacterized membrane protein HdeD (DUF308 family)
MSEPGGTGGAGLSGRDGDVLEVVGRSWGWVLFFGIVTLILGLLVVIHPRDTVYAFAIVLGIWLFVAGLFRIITAIADKEDTGGYRWLMAFLGLLAVIVGVLFLRRTDETVTTLGFLIGLFWLVGGIIEFFTAYSDRGSDGRGFRIGMGVLGFAAGLVTLVWPNITLSVLAWIMGIWLIIYAVLEIVLSMQLRRLVH